MTLTSSWLPRLSMKIILRGEEQTITTQEPTWTEIGSKTRRDRHHDGSTSPSPPSSHPSSPRSTPTPIATTAYYKLLQPDSDDVEMHDDADDEVQIIEPTRDPIQDTLPALHQKTTEISNSNMPHPVPLITQTPNQNHLSPLIRLRNPYRSKHKKPRNPAFAKQLRNYIATRSALAKNSTNSMERSVCPPNTSQIPTHTLDPHQPMPTEPPQAATVTQPPPDAHEHTSHAANSTSNTTYQPPDPFVLINDGTQRLTVRWKPVQFDNLESNSSDWDQTLLTALCNIFHDHISRTAVVKWGEQHTPDNNAPLATITSETIRQYLSPNISVLKSNKTFIFGIRLCAPDNHLSAWITRANTRELLQTHHMEITISNSKSSSGNVITAGYILMKHPIYTQRYFFLLSLRKALPPNTPFFDLAIHRRTPHGETTAHIVVKCGENHITGLSEILSNYLDGQKNNTALFVASQAVKSMTQEEIGKMFDAHRQYVDDIQRLTLYPKVINIDRERPKQQGSNTITRSTRQWAQTLKTDQGKSLRCDVENGGADRRAYLLVVSQHLDRAKVELHNYLQALTTATRYSQRDHSDNDHRPAEPTRPTEIYIPTPAVMNNLKFLNTLTSAEVWKCAPTTIRSPPASGTNQQNRLSYCTASPESFNPINKSIRSPNTN